MRIIVSYVKLMRIFSWAEEAKKQTEKLTLALSAPSTPDDADTSAEQHVVTADDCELIVSSPAELPSREFDIDTDDHNDEFAVTEYTHEIYQFLREREVCAAHYACCSLPQPSYLDTQAHQ